MVTYRISLALFSILSMPMLAHADDRFGCMAEDRRLKLAVNVEFAGDLGGRLSHLSGKLAVADAKAPQGLGDRRLTNQAVTQHWGRDGLVMLRLFDDETDSRALDITLAAASAEPGARQMHGHYTIRSTADGVEPYEVSGALFCQKEPERTALLKMYPSEVE